MSAKPLHAEGEGDVEKFDNVEVSEHVVDGEDETKLVEWDGPNDPKNPQNWSNSRKWCLVSLVSAVTFNMYVCCQTFLPIP